MTGASSDNSEGPITALLRVAARGDRGGLDRLFELVYGELRRIASGLMEDERVNHTLQPTALVSKLYIKLLGQETLDFRDRAHFFGSAAKAMRRLLIDHARRRAADRRGGSAGRVELSTDLLSPDGVPGLIDVLDLEDALEELARLNAKLAELVQLRFYGGLSIEETAEVMGVSSRTINTDWKKAYHWLRDMLGLDP